MTGNKTPDPWGETERRALVEDALAFLAEGTDWSASSGPRSCGSRLGYAETVIRQLLEAMGVEVER